MIIEHFITGRKKAQFRKGLFFTAGYEILLGIFTFGQTLNDHKFVQL